MTKMIPLMTRRSSTPWHPARQREMGLDPPHLRFGQPDQVTHRQRLLDAAIESTDHSLRKRFNGS